MSDRGFRAEEWLGGCAAATFVSSVVTLPALTVIIIALWLWERVAGGDSAATCKDDSNATRKWCE